MGDVKIYDTDERNLLKLNWSIISEKYKNELRELLEKSMGNSNIKITLATFRKLYVRDLKDNIVGYFDCIYDDNNWSVVPLDF